MKPDLMVQVAPRDIDMLTKIIEAYEHLGVVSTVDRASGLVRIRGTEDTIPELLAILKHVAFTVEILD